MNQMRVGEGTVVLLAGGGKVYTDVAARFTRSERGLSEIIASPYNADLVRTSSKKDTCRNGVRLFFLASRIFRVRRCSWLESASQAI
jgi:hypothetical protein